MVTCAPIARRRRGSIEVARPHRLGQPRDITILRNRGIEASRQASGGKENEMVKMTITASELEQLCAQCAQVTDDIEVVGTFGTEMAWGVWGHCACGGKIEAGRSDYDERYVRHDGPH
jgi:hypothetical protein